MEFKDLFIHMLRYEQLGTYKKSKYKNKVRCITTGEVYDNVDEAARASCLSKSTLWKSCNGDRKHAGCVDKITNQFVKCDELELPSHITRATWEYV
jgi:hypothetical protein